MTLDVSQDYGDTLSVGIDEGMNKKHNFASKLCLQSQQNRSATFKFKRLLKTGNH